MRSRFNHNAFGSFCWYVQEEAGRGHLELVARAREHEQSAVVGTTT